MFNHFRTVLITKFRIPSFKYQILFLFLFICKAIDAQNFERQWYDYGKNVFMNLLVLDDDQPLTITKIGIELIPRPHILGNEWAAFAPGINYDTKAKYIFEVPLWNFEKRIIRERPIKPIVLEPRGLNLVDIGWRLDTSGYFQKPFVDVYVRSFMVSELGDKLYSKWMILKYEDFFQANIASNEQEVFEWFASEDQQIAALKGLAALDVKDRPNAAKNIERLINSEDEELVSEAIRACYKANYNTFREQIKGFIEDSKSFKIVLEALRYQFLRNEIQLQKDIYAHLAESKDFTIKDAAMIEMAGVMKQKEVIPFIFTRLETYDKSSEAYEYSSVLTDALKLMNDRTVRDLLPLLIESNAKQNDTIYQLREEKYSKFLALAAFYKVDAAIDRIEEALFVKEATKNIELVVELSKMAKFGNENDVAFVRKFESFLSVLAKKQGVFSYPAYEIMLHLNKGNEKKTQKWVKFGMKKEILKDLAVKWKW